MSATMGTEDNSDVVRIVAERVAIFTGTSPTAILSRDRTAKAAEARGILIHVLRYACWSYPAIGDALGHRTHSSILRLGRTVAAPSEKVLLDLSAGLDRQRRGPRGPVIESTKVMLDRLDEAKREAAECVEVMGKLRAYADFAHEEWPYSFPFAVMPPPRCFELEG